MTTIVFHFLLDPRGPMAAFKDQRFSDEQIELDGNTYDGCTFTKCQ
jgi:hypothetical protein